jgi:hypothetical protein
MGYRKIKDIMQVFFYCAVAICLYFGVNWSGEATGDKPFDDLQKILAVMDKHEIEVTDWTLYSREQLNNWKTSGEYDSEFNLLKEKTNQFEWEPLTEDPQRSQMKAVATLTHNDLGVTETLSYIIYPHNDQLHSYLIYNVHGTRQLSEAQWKTLLPITESRLEDLFHKNTKIFTCATGNGSDKLNLGLSEQADKLLADFSAQTIESLKEETFISISAYTNTWNNAIATNNQNMNLQVAIRAKERLGGKTTVTIGTPIITTEY